MRCFSLNRTRSPTRNLGLVRHRSQSSSVKTLPHLSFILHRHVFRGHANTTMFAGIVIIPRHSLYFYQFSHPLMIQSLCHDGKKRLEMFSSRFVQGVAQILFQVLSSLLDRDPLCFGKSWHTTQTFTGGRIVVSCQHILDLHAFHHSFKSLRLLLKVKSFDSTKIF